MSKVYKKPIRLTDDQKSQLINQYKDNHSIKSLANQYNVSISTVTRLTKSYRKTITKPSVQDILNDHKNKMSWEDLIKKYDISQGTLAKILRDNRTYKITNEPLTEELIL